ncbi:MULTISPECIES: hypothetical protein [unclassified Leptolyngbya]|uniref:hypothetical protein n=1 Tax=unclassified Leptolyngbya TaxID=2650499 RepID=UPI001685729E|nr:MULTISPECIES: hypothetical protein [unclassified Leptolyngbya]MBD1912622.1 hypothetical protein [Leptolyngbya sp. FACHB-8]MBD2156792.1 hypothetical protein [Leptolyngbya sp. FACHB-16]
MAVLITILVLGVYSGGMYKFWKGFNRTNFSQNRLMLTLCWPVFIFNPSYRQNFTRALKG